MLEKLNQTSYFPRVVNILFAVVLVLGLAPITALSQADKAFGSPAQTISGYAYVHCVNPGPTMNDGNLFDVTMPGGDVIRGYCIDHGNNFPADGSYPYTGTWNGTSYNILVDSSGADRHPACIGNVWPCQRVGNFTWTPSGAIDLQKLSSDTSITDGNSCYTKAGAEYGIYYDENCTDYWFSMKTNDSGYWKTDNDIPIDTYWVKEIKAPNGYAVDGTRYKVEVNINETTRVNGDKGGVVYDPPKNDPAAALLKKYDGEKTYGVKNLPQGSASLALGQYTFRFYGGQYNTVEQAEASGKLLRTWAMQTDENGTVELQNGEKTFQTKDGTTHNYKVSGDEFYHATSGKIILPLGTLVIQETKAPEGYRLPDPNTIFVQHITGPGTGETVNTYNAPLAPEPVIRGGVEMPKIDRETNLNSPLGGASVDGAVFTIKNMSEQAVKVNGKTINHGQDACNITTVDGIATTATNTLPYGKYELRETLPPTGYLPSDEVWAFEITEDGKIVTPTLEQSIDDQVKRGDLEFVKTNEIDMSRLSTVPFKLTSETTGENHILVTDANGQVSTENSWNAHSASTNANDTLAEGTYKPESGVWFGLAKDGTTAPVDDTLGALPYDTYTLEELPCTANDGLQLIKLTGVTIARDKVTINLGTIDDPGKNELFISTTAWDGIDLDKIAVSDPEAKITDKVSYNNAAPNKTYTLKGELMDKATGEPVVIDGVAVTAEKTFVAALANGYVNMEFAFDATKLGGHDVVVFETLYQNGAIVAEHKELADTEQTVKLVAPEIGTTALDGADGDKNVISDPEATVIDTVAFRNLIVGKEYKVSGTLMDKETGEALVIDGNPVVSETTFVPETTNGTVDVTFAFDASLLKGKELVAFETLTRLDKELAVHADIEDASQTVTVIVPEIGTTALDGVDGDKNVVADTNAEVVDSIAFKNLVIGKEYKVSGTLMDKETGEALVIDGNPVVSETTFVPETTNGTVDVTFTFDASLLKGKELVAFETLTRLDKEVAVHADIEDEAQTVTIVVPEIGTTATDSLDGDKNVVADPEAKVVDTVSYENLLPGDETYVMAGILMDKATGLPVLAGEGADKVDTKKLDEFVANLAKVLGLAPAADEPNKDTTETEQGTDTSTDTQEKAPVLPVAVDFEALAKLMEQNADLLSLMSTATQEFTPEASSGTIDMEYAFDASTLAGKDTVVFEMLIKDTAVVAIHADLTDEDQTTSVVPSTFGTKASDKTDGDSELIASATATIVDQIGYTDLLPGKEYEIKGVLMDKATGKPLMVKDQKVEASTTFTPNAPYGVIELEYSFDASALAGHELVVFETLYKDGKEIYVHADINDANQTVKIVEAPRGKFFDKTGNNLTGILVLAAACLFGGAGAIAYGVKQRRFANKTNTESEQK